MSKQPKYGPWEIYNHGETDCPSWGVRVQVNSIYLSRQRAEEGKTWLAKDITWENVCAYRILREPVKETHSYPMYLTSFANLGPMISDSEVNGSVKGTVTTDIVDGKPVRSVWVADGESE